MVGLQATAIKTQLGPLLNGIVNFDYWIPASTMQFQGVLDMLKQYQAKSANEGVDTLGWYIAPWGYAYLEVLGQAIEGAKSIDQAKIADHLRSHTFKTVVGDVKFGKDGEWEKARVIFLQYRGIKSTDIAEFRDTTHQIIVEPQQYKVGDAIYPYNEAKTKP
jgi:branched-chain amino acid transport system substrate-binding protein